MKNFILSYILIIYSLYFIISVKIEKPTEIDLDYITVNFDNLSQKSNLVQSFTKISNSGNITLMETFLSKLKEKKN